jgi:hypothetical protein
MRTDAAVENQLVTGGLKAGLGGGQLIQEDDARAILGRQELRAIPARETLLGIDPREASKVDRVQGGQPLVDKLHPLLAGEFVDQVGLADAWTAPEKNRQPEVVEDLEGRQDLAGRFRNRIDQVLVLSEFKQAQALPGGRGNLFLGSGARAQSKHVSDPGAIQRWEPTQRAAQPPASLGLRKK